MELAAQYGGSPVAIGKEMKRLGYAARHIRLRREDRTLTKKRALYCVRVDAAFTHATPTQLRMWLAREHYAEASQRAAATVASALASVRF